MNSYELHCLAPFGSFWKVIAVFSSCRGTEILQLEEVFLQEIHNIPQPSFPKASCPTCLSLSICIPNPSINIHQPKWPRHSQQIYEISPWDSMAIATTKLDSWWFLGLPSDFLCGKPNLINLSFGNGVWHWLYHITRLPLMISWCINPIVIVKETINLYHGRSWYITTNPS